MEKKLPGIYKNPIDHPVQNNKEMTYVKPKQQEEPLPQSRSREDKIRKSLFGNDVLGKLNHIFKTSQYIYKVKVEITTNSGTTIKNIIGKNRDFLITMDNERIPISEIQDIKLLDEKAPD